ncbi:P-loop containing nucleoside triphosphate hydrolase protein [Patellaria atrata CBS 101060]|uniref:P-loop containing nucleoside triphosphate hydrolase protein n=1 Tax=Patellaria atrata CBS 101060 TaxID=1346257 RepID=A0A9P4S5Q3_9PEZI|nr:P-loop containing nucleoside triphosphate hydrolase protein [Patellaria atrata CBS 101060]
MEHIASEDSSKLPSSSSSRRLPTVTASQVLENLKSQAPRAISTALERLDAILTGAAGNSYSTWGSGGGLTRGKVTEVYGPPGAGKTTFGYVTPFDQGYTCYGQRNGIREGFWRDMTDMSVGSIQACVSALRAGDDVVWIDAAAPLAPRRVKEILSASLSYKKGATALTPIPHLSSDDLAQHFHHYTTPTLPHLLALLVHPPPSFPPPGTSLIVIDSISTVFENAYPHIISDQPGHTKSETTRWAAGRRYSAMSEVALKLSRAAALHNITVLLLNQVNTRVRAGSGAMLHPALSGTEWDNTISTRLVLFRDWLPAQLRGHGISEDQRTRVRFVGVVKVGGVTLADDGTFGAVVPFTIETTGLADLDLASADLTTTIQPSTSPARPPSKKRRIVAEIADSDAGSDEEYGWADDDELAAEGLLVDETLLEAETAEEVEGET